MVAKDTTFKHAIDLAAETGQALQFDLQEHGGIAITLFIVDKTAADELHIPATAFITDAGYCLEGLVVIQRVISAANQMPGVTQRPQERDVSLLENVATVAVGKVQ